MVRELVTALTACAAILVRVSRETVDRADHGRWAGRTVGEGSVPRNDCGHSGTSLCGPGEGVAADVDSVRVLRTGVARACRAAQVGKFRCAAFDEGPAFPTAPSRNLLLAREGILDHVILLDIEEGHRAASAGVFRALSGIVLGQSTPDVSGAADVVRGV